MAHHEKLCGRRAVWNSGVSVCHYQHVSRQAFQFSCPSESGLFWEWDMLRFQKILAVVSNRSGTYGSLDISDHWCWESNPFDVGMV